MPIRHFYRDVPSITPILATLALIALVPTGLVGKDDPAVAKPAAASRIVGRKISDFVLPDPQGKMIGLGDYNDKRGVVVVFLGTACPIGNAYLPILAELRTAYAAKQIEVLGIYANPGDTQESISKHRTEYNIEFPVLLDAKQETLGLFGATRMAETFLLDSRYVVQYHGRIDDRIGYDYKREDAQHHDLRNAIDALLSNEPIAKPETDTAGCLITHREQRKKRGTVNYAEHIAPLLAKHCVDCHHPGTAAPFSLTSYDDAANWAEMMREVVVQRRMPPWHADPRFGTFANDRRLSVEEIDTLAAWVDSGSPLGDPAKVPAAPTFEQGWRIGRPDIVFTMPRTYKVPAKGTVSYQYFVTPTDFKEDMWVQAAEPRPGSRAAVHHIIVYYRDPKNPETKKTPVWITATAPGADPTIFPPGMARKIPAGAELVWQMHYTPTGKEEVDQSEVGFVFAKEPPQHEVKNHGVTNMRFAIPPGDSHFRIAASEPVRHDTVVLALFPHMHLRGRDFSYFAVDPKGNRTKLLSVPQYDFNWQLSYRLAEPLELKKGSRIECEAHFDNSPRNPANPDPKATVKFGEQTWEEMMFGYVEFYTKQ